MKKYFKNKSLCQLPFAGLYIEPSGNVKCCSISKQTLGNIHTQSIQDLINGETVKSIRRDMLEEKFPSNCNECYEKEKLHVSLLNYGISAHSLDKISLRASIEANTSLSYIIDEL